MASAMATVDDGAAFLQLMELEYASLEEFQDAFRQFQFNTSTCFYIYNSRTAAQCLRHHGKQLPPGVQYEFIKYCCVHRNRKSNQGVRFKNYNCEAFVVVRFVGSLYCVTKWSMVHSHRFHVGQTSLYSGNRRLTPTQEHHVSNLMDTFKSSREIREYAFKTFGRRLNLSDIQQIRLRHQKLDQRTEAEKVRDLLKGHGRFRIRYREDIIRFVFFVPNSAVHLCEKQSEVILADATHQLNYGGYILWHAMLVDVTGVGRSFFYALMPNESTISYSLAIQTLVELVPPVLQCKTIVVDRSLAQYNAFREYFPSCRIIFCRFHVLRDMKKKCNNLVGLTTVDKHRLFIWMRYLVYAESESQFNRFLGAIGARSDEALGYLTRTWLPYKEMWAGYLIKDALVFGNLTTNRVETENRHLKIGLSPRSTVIEVFSQIVKRVTKMDEERGRMIAQQMLGIYKPPMGLGWLKPLLGPLSVFARCTLLSHLKATNIKEVKYVRNCWVVTLQKGRKYRLTMGNTPKCERTFNRQWCLPCAHIIRVAKLINYDLARLANGSRWVVNNLPDAEYTNTETAVAASEIESQPQVMKKNEKLALSEDLAKDIVVTLSSMGDTNFRKQLHSLRAATAALAKYPSLDIMARIPGQKKILPIASVDAETEKILM